MSHISTQNPNREGLPGVSFCILCCNVQAGTKIIILTAMILITVIITIIITLTLSGSGCGGYVQGMSCLSSMPVLQAKLLQHCLLKAHTAGALVCL